jgi:hypothetical protein
MMPETAGKVDGEVVNHGRGKAGLAEIEGADEAVIFTRIFFL